MHVNVFGETLFDIYKLKSPSRYYAPSDFKCALREKLADHVPVFDDCNDLNWMKRTGYESFNRRADLIYDQYDNFITYDPAKPLTVFAFEFYNNGDFNIFSEITDILDFDIDLNDINDDDFEFDKFKPFIFSAVIGWVYDGFMKRNVSFNISELSKYMPVYDPIAMLFDMHEIWKDYNQTEICSYLEIDEDNKKYHEIWKEYTEIKECRSKSYKERGVCSACHLYNCDEHPYYYMERCENKNTDECIDCDDIDNCIYRKDKFLDDFYNKYAKNNEDDMSESKSKNGLCEICGSELSSKVSTFTDINNNTHATCITFCEPCSSASTKAKETINIKCNKCGGDRVATRDNKGRRSLYCHNCDNDEYFNKHNNTNTQEEVTMAGKIKEAATKNVADLKDAAIDVAQITAAKQVNKLITVALKKKAPIFLKSYMDEPMIQAALGVVVTAMIEQYKPNEMTARLAYASKQAMFLELGETLNIDGIINEALAAFTGEKINIEKS
jgi:hypothetical protein